MTVATRRLSTPQSLKGRTCGAICASGTSSTRVPVDNACGRVSNCTLAEKGRAIRRSNLKRVGCYADQQ